MNVVFVMEMDLHVLTALEYLTGLPFVICVVFVMVIMIRVLTALEYLKGVPWVMCVVFVVGVLVGVSVGGRGGPKPKNRISLKGPLLRKKSRNKNWRLVCAGYCTPRRPLVAPRGAPRARRAAPLLDSANAPPPPRLWP